MKNKRLGGIFSSRFFWGICIVGALVGVALFSYNNTAVLSSVLLVIPCHESLRMELIERAYLTNEPGRALTLIQAGRHC